jgi:hypothetical protein
MARPKKLIRTVYKNIALPEDLAAKVELELYSEVEGKIPFGAQQEFFSRLLREYFDNRAGSVTTCK